MSNCIFCEIVARRAPSSIAWEDEQCCAFMDIEPVTPGHLLIVPKRHAGSLAELDPETGAHMFQVAQRLAGVMRHSGFRCEGIDLFLADGAAAGQDVFHVHLHVIPRYRGDGFGFRFGPDYGKRPHRMELDTIAGAIREQL